MKTPYRHLTLRHEERLIRDIPRELGPGEAVFRSYYQPSLQGGPHTISIDQTVDVSQPSGSTVTVQKANTIKKDFTVVAPHFSLPAASLDSVFPPPGHGALPKILPHIVLSDPHFPWEQPPFSSDASAKDEKNKGCIPWVALIAFTAKELQPDPDALKDLQQTPDVKPNESLGFDLPVAVVDDIRKKSAAFTSVMVSPDEREKKESTAAVFIPKVLFGQLFADANGICSVKKYQYLSHVRKVATDGMVSAADGQTGLYSIVVSHRLGPLDVAGPTPLFVHLVSIENIDGRKMADLKGSILMTSLYSWSYTLLPPDSADVTTMLKRLGKEGLQFLRSTPAAPKPKTTTSTEDIVSKRQDDGYTIVRHRPITGEQTAAMYRGPLVPNPVDYQMQPQSNFGSDLQILDPQLSLVDISYASAWQLGKTLAMGDEAFTAALSRVRGAIQTEAVNAAKIDLYRRLGAYSSRREIVAGMKDLVAGLSQINRHLHATRTAAVSGNRWKRDPVPSIDATLQSPHILRQLYAKAASVAREIGSSEDGTPYNYHKMPTNTDFAVVQNWLLDKLHLAGVPPHYFIPDPSYLPPESLRFFYVDENWTKAMVDGALSLANHWASDADKDFARSALKEAVNASLSFPHEKLGYAQQMPRYGFLLRSQVLVQFPDLAVKATPETKKPAAAVEKPQVPILVQRMLEADVMLVLFDRAPPDLLTVELTLPPHQLCFAAGEEVSPTKLTVAFRKILATDKPPTDRGARVGEVARRTFTQADDEVFDWGSRTLRVTEFATAVFKNLESKMPKEYFKETSPTSALLALQLNEATHTLKIGVKDGTSAAALMAHGQFRPFRLDVPAWPFADLVPDPLPLRPTLPPWPRTRLGRPSPRTAPLCGSKPPVDLCPFDDPVADRPRFKLALYPPGNPSLVPTNRTVPPDLIVSITLPAAQHGLFSWRLVNLRVKIPIGDKPVVPRAPAPAPLLRRGYRPPQSPPMLSNLRFNVLRGGVVRDGEGDEGDFLVLDVVPRSSLGVDVKGLREASFVLPRVDVLPWVKKQKTKVGLWAFYKDEPKPFDDGAEVLLEPEAAVNEDEGADGWDW